METALICHAILGASANASERIVFKGFHIKDILSTI